MTWNKFDEITNFAVNSINKEYKTRALPNKEGKMGYYNVKKDALRYLEDFFLGKRLEAVEAKIKLIIKETEDQMVSVYLNNIALEYLAYQFLFAFFYF